MSEVLNNITLDQIQNDSTLMLMAGVAVVVLLIVVLTIVVSTMRVKAHKDRFWEVLSDNKLKAESLVELGQDLQGNKIKEAQYKQELMHFDETKATLQKTTNALNALKSELEEREKELSQIRIHAEVTEKMYDNLHTEYEALQERHNIVQEENIKCRTNNARLLMKLEKQ